MTKKQTEEMERLADSHRPYLTKESFFAGYKAAQRLDQLILNEHVKFLVKNIESIVGAYKVTKGSVTYQLSDDFKKLVDYSINNLSKYIEPFQNLGGESE